MTIVNCKDCHNENCRECGNYMRSTCWAFKEAPKLTTNYDRIRAKSMEELAETGGGGRDMKYIITYRAFKKFPSKETYINKDIAKWRYAELKNCVNADNVKMEIEKEKHIITPEEGE